MIDSAQITRFEEAKAKFEALKPQVMRHTLKDDELWSLDQMLSSVHLHVILDFIAAKTYEAADSCDGDARDWLMQQASVVSAAALFCKTWEPGK